LGKEIIDNRQVKDGQAILHRDLAIMRAFNGKPISALMGWDGLLIWDSKISVVQLVDSYLRKLSIYPVENATHAISD
jgi:hypothetical protein